MWLRRLVFLMLLLLPGLSGAATGGAGAAAAGVGEISGAGLSTADHSRFAELDRPFATGPEVTRACLKCHNQAGTQVQGSIHWTWECEPGAGADKPLGKAHVVNNF